MISQNSIQQILSRIDIIDVVGEYVKLKKRGANYLGLCPFHNEKTPSFTVSPSKEIYKCFGCGKSGNTISFLMEHDKYSYVEALKWLANRYNIEVEETFASEEQRQERQVADSLYIVNQFARDFFSQQLFDSEEGRDIGLDYFKERGFREEIIKRFDLGYSPEDRHAFSNAALKAQYNRDLLLKSGLVVERNGELQDNYRGRVIFPIHNQSGKVLGFGARILVKNDRAPKYINTPENEIYIKSRILYGLYFARQAMDKADECLLVEGYTDVLSLHQSGIENVVASGGTSLTIEQLRQIKKYTDNLTILYDGDAAGVKAALRGLDMALEEGLNVKLALIPDNEDPDSYMQKVGPAAFREFIQQNKKDFILFQLEVALKEAGTDSQKKSALVNQIAETISKINKAEDFTRQQDYVKQSAQILQVDEEGMHALVNQHIRTRIAKQEKALAGDQSKQREENIRLGEEKEFSDESFNLLFKDEMQEREIARILLEYGTRPFDSEQLVADFVFAEMMDESLFDDETVLRLLAEYRNIYGDPEIRDPKSHFIYHRDEKLSSLAVSLLNFPYEESDYWRKESGLATGYQQRLFKQDYETFIHTLAQGNEEELRDFLKMGEDKTPEQVQSALSYLKLRKIRRLLIENQSDMEKNPPAAEMEMFIRTHLHLKELEREITSQLQTVILR